MNLIAATAFGLEAITKRELIALGFDAQVIQPGRIRFTGDWSAICQANLWLRTADRVMIEALNFPAADFDALFDTIKAFDFSQFLPVNAAFPVTGKSRLSQLTSVPAIQRTVKKALVESLQRFHQTETLPEDGPTYPFEIALLDDVATLTIDTSGPSLHKRGYRRLAAEAPIKETLAAAMIDLSVWNPARLLVDPFCGSGTIPIEAAMIGMNIAPGLYRNFVSSDWPVIPAQAWIDAKQAARDSIAREVHLQIIGSDRDPAVLEMARFHAEKAGVAHQIHFKTASFEDLESQRQYGCIVTNPPYGERLEDLQRLQHLYFNIPVVMQRLPTWSLFLITNFPHFEKLVEQRATRRRKLYNGRLECTYYQYLGPRPPKDWEEATDSLAPLPTVTQSIPETLDRDRQSLHHQSSPILGQVNAEPTKSTSAAEPAISTPLTVVNALAKIDLPVRTIETVAQPAQIHTFSTETPAANTSTNPRSAPADLVPVESIAKTAPIVAPLFGGLEPKDYEQADLFHKRLTKVARHLRKWPTKRGITCFRLYERDIPEIPLVVDRYENHLHISEYERPHERGLARHVAWLELMKQTAATTLEIPLEQVFLKQRTRNRDRSQYEKLGNAGNLFSVNESGLEFLVNLTDYMDTGLFLDHRNTRQMVHDEARDTHFLNLFAYTGSFSVYAAAAGALATTTVDLSKNYLQWAEKNMAINELTGPQHRFIAADAMEFLQSAGRNPRQRFDLAVVDPPTYSNSKRTEVDWDVQQNHVELLNALRVVMRTGGIVYFSTNFRRFKLAANEIPGFEFLEISKQTVPEDFRNRRIHRCWRMRAI